MRQLASRVGCRLYSKSDLAGHLRRAPHQRSGDAYLARPDLCPPHQPYGIRLSHRQIFLGVAVSLGCQFLSEDSIPDR